MFNITDQEAMVTPAPYAPNALDPNCHVFEIEVEKYFDTGDLVFTTPGTTGNDDNWTTEVIFPNGLNSILMAFPIHGFSCPETIIECTL